MVYCARTGKFTLITCHRRRGRAGIDDAGVLGRIAEWRCTDAWAPYDTLDAEHQLCCAHALRELQAVNAVTDTAPDTDWCWATQAGDALVALQKVVGQAIAAGADALDPAAPDEQVRRYRWPPRSVPPLPPPAPTR